MATCDKGPTGEIIELKWQQEEEEEECVWHDSRASFKLFTK